MAMKSIIGLILFAANAYAQWSDAMLKTDWCNPALCDTAKEGSVHIACNNPRTFDPSCQKPRNVVIPPACQDVILKAHNTYRDTVASGLATAGGANCPKAARMLILEWDPLLAELAKLNCMRCNFQHDTCRNTDRFEMSGQNLGIEYAVTPMERLDCNNFVQNRLKSFYAEKDYIVPEVFRAYRSANDLGLQGYGHATTMFTDRSTHVGCHICQFQIVRSGKTYNATELACNYASTNVNGAYVYVPATTIVGKECATGKDGSFPNSCSRFENSVIDVNDVRFSA